MELRKNSVYALLILSIIMVIVSAVITYFNSVEKKESTKLIIHTYQAIQSSTELLSLLKDMETGQRGYVITGDSTFLEPYIDANAKLDSEVDTLKNLVSENTQQSNLLEGKIIAVVNRKSKDIKNSIQIFKTFGRDSASLRVATKIGKAHMDTLRILVGNLVQQQKALLAQHSHTLDKNTQMEDSIRFSAFAIIALTILVALITIIEKQRSNDMLMQELKIANERLEQKVEERTRQLVDANQAKDHFLGIASHDLKVPISGILGLIHLMNLENKSRPTNDVEYLGYMEDSCNNMQCLISNLLDINQIERGAIIIF